MQPDDIVAFLHWFAGLVVLAEGLNKLERASPLARGLQPRQRCVLLLKVAAWLCLVFGAAGAIARPFVVVAWSGDLRFGHIVITDSISLADLLVVGGFALLIVRSRFKETRHHEPHA